MAKRASGNTVRLGRAGGSILQHLDCDSGLHRAKHRFASYRILDTPKSGIWHILPAFNIGSQRMHSVGSAETVATKSIGLTQLRCYSWSVFRVRHPIAHKPSI